MLNCDNVDVWVATFALEQPKIARYLAVLSGNDCRRLEQMAHATQKSRFIIARGVLRYILADYLAVAPVEIEFGVGVHGKPSVLHDELQFNISHSVDYLLIAVARSCPVGVDVELIRRRHNLVALAKRCLSDVEYQFWLGLPEEERVIAFYQFWVAKEAFVKAVGRGIGLGLASCQLRLPDLAMFECLPDDFGDGNDWTLQRFAVSDAYEAAVVMPSLLKDVNSYRYGF